MFQTTMCVMKVCVFFLTSFPPFPLSPFSLFSPLFPPSMKSHLLVPVLRTPRAFSVSGMRERERKRQEKEREGKKGGGDGGVPGPHVGENIPSHPIPSLSLFFAPFLLFFLLSSVLFLPSPLSWSRFLLNPSSCFIPSFLHRPPFFLSLSLSLISSRGREKHQERREAGGEGGGGQGNPK